MKYFLLSLFLMVMLVGCAPKNKSIDQAIALLKVSDNHRYLQTEAGDPFFYLGDTGWLLFTKLTREEANVYLDNRAAKGFNVIQVMVLHTLKSCNVYGDSALILSDVAKPLLTEGNSFTDSMQYDFWDHVDYVVDLAASKGIYMGLVPVWGSNVKGGKVSQKQATVYAAWLANRYKDKTNVIWLNGGDIMGSDSIKVWNAIGSTINELDANHLITFHARGRHSSSQWFHNEDWLDFNMFQSGHRRYDQDDTEWNFGEDNWRWVEQDLAFQPAKPTIDGEPSYEGIPQGLHDGNEPYWTDSDVRRYGYWSVFAGAMGYTYGNNAIMQFHKPADVDPAYFVKEFWDEAMDMPGAGQMQHLKKLMLSHAYFDRVQDQTLIAGENGEKYNRVIGTRGNDYAMIYSYSGGDISVAMGKISGKEVNAKWFDPRSGEETEIGTFKNSGTQTFTCPGEAVAGNDWVLILEKSPTNLP
ncbi:MAG: glycoside hydrolase family 140 protein [Prolixibacteraceae bacterium]